MSDSNMIRDRNDDSVLSEQLHELKKKKCLLERQIESNREASYIHDLKSPITAVKGSAQYLLFYERNYPAVWREKLTAIEELAARMDSVVEGHRPSL